MKSTDKFLIGIVISLVVLVVAAFAVALLRPQPEFQPETTPEGVAHNYLLAIQQRDLARAYSYLDPDLPGFPSTFTDFTSNLNLYTGSLDANRGSVSLEVLSADISADQATITVRETNFSQGGLFDSGQYTTTFLMHLRRDGPDAPWKLTRSDRYWAWCWSDEEGCR